MATRLVPYQKSWNTKAIKCMNPDSLSYKMFDDQPIYPTTYHEIMFE